jgi:hypothetical protein
MYPTVILQSDNKILGFLYRHNTDKFQGTAEFRVPIFPINLGIYRLTPFSSFIHSFFPSSINHFFCLFLAPSVLVSIHFQPIENTRTWIYMQYGRYITKNNLHICVNCNLTTLFDVNDTEEQMNIECQWNNTDRKNQNTRNKNSYNFHFIVQKSNMECPRTATETPCWETE